jgi:hypothetical protein
MSIEKLSASAKRTIDNEINKINKGLEKLQSNGVSHTTVRNLIKETIGYNTAVRENKSGQIIISRSTANKQIFDYVHKMKNNGSQELHNIVSSLNINTSGKGRNKSLDLFKALEDITRKNEQHNIKQPNISKGNIIKKLSSTNIQMTMINSATNEMLFDSDETASVATNPLDENEDYRLNIGKQYIETQRYVSDKATFSSVQKQMRNGFKILGEHYTPYGDGLGFIRDSTGEYFDNFADVLKFIN